MDAKQEPQDKSSSDCQAEVINKFIALIADSLTERVVASIPVTDTSQIEALCKKTVYAQDGMSKQLEILGTNNQMLEEINRMNIKLSDRHYDDRIITPMVGALLPVMDLIDDAAEKLRRQEVSDKHTSIRNLMAIKMQLSQFLACYGISPFSSKPEEQFEALTMKTLRKIITKEPKLNDLVAESLQSGFRFGDKILRMETVSLYETA